MMYRAGDFNESTEFVECAAQASRVITSIIDHTKSLDLMRKYHK
jgi:hypothetical protein